MTNLDMIYAVGAAEIPFWKPERLIRKNRKCDVWKTWTGEPVTNDENKMKVVLSVHTDPQKSTR